MLLPQTYLVPSAVTGQQRSMATFSSPCCAGRQTMLLVRERSLHPPAAHFSSPTVAIFKFPLLPPFAAYLVNVSEFRTELFVWYLLRN